MVRGSLLFRAGALCLHTIVHCVRVTDMYSTRQQQSDDDNLTIAQH